MKKALDTEKKFIADKKAEIAELKDILRTETTQRDTFLGHCTL